MSTTTGIILGSGLNKFEDELNSAELLYEDKDSFHKLKILKGNIDGNEVVLFSGRRHFYEGYTNDKILEGVEIARKIGIKLLIITNAAGGLNPGFNVSDLMLITAHLNFLYKKFSGNAGNMYDRKKLELVRKFAAEEKIILRSGSYCCTTGPMYETTSEIRLLNKFKIDAVGMSTIPETLYGNSMGIQTIGFSCITNLLSENPTSKTTHDEVIEAGNVAYSNFSKLLKKIILNSSELIN